VSTIASILVWAVKCVNLPTRHQHLFDVVAKLNKIDLNIVLYLLPCSSSNFTQNVIIWSVRGNNYFRQISLKSMQYSCQVKELYLSWDAQKMEWTEERKEQNIGRKTGQKLRWTRQKTMPPAQHRLWKHNYILKQTNVSTYKITS